MRNPPQGDRGADALRITTQFRVLHGMAYELRAHGTRLTILITKPDGRAAWSCEAFIEPTRSIAALANTRAAALRTASELWKPDGPERGLPAFDWDAVTRALADVRAI